MSYRPAPSASCLQGATARFHRHHCISVPLEVVCITWLAHQVCNGERASQICISQVHTFDAVGEGHDGDALRGAPHHSMHRYCASGGLKRLALQSRIAATDRFAAIAASVVGKPGLGSWLGSECCLLECLSLVHCICTRCAQLLGSHGVGREIANGFVLIHLRIQQSQARAQLLRDHGAALVACKAQQQPSDVVT